MSRIKDMAECMSMALYVLRFAVWPCIVWIVETLAVIALVYLGYRINVYLTDI